MDDFERSRQALDMLDAFQFVGVERFALTLTDLAGHKTDYRSDCSIGILREYMYLILKKSASGRKNVIIRPKPSRYAIYQLDDLTAEAVERLRPVSYLAYCTSPGSYQSWIAVADGDADFARRVKRGVGADPSASGATRVCGSYNFKPKYAPDYPLIRAVHSAPGLVIQSADMDALGVVVAPETAHVRPPRHASPPPGGPLRFPDYADCLRKAPRRQDGEPDRSKADFFFCYLAAKWGWSAEAVAAELLRVSVKAQAKGAGYALLTARNAAANARKHGGGAG